MEKFPRSSLEKGTPWFDQKIHQNQGSIKVFIDPQKSWAFYHENHPKPEVKNNLLLDCNQKTNRPSSSFDLEKNDLHMNTIDDEYFSDDPYRGSFSNKEIRNKFIRKVYGIIGVQLAVTITICAILYFPYFLIIFY